MCVEGVILGVVALSSGIKQSEQVMWSKSKSSNPPWPLHQVFPPSSLPVFRPVLTSFFDELWYESESQINPFFPKLIWPWCFMTARVTITQTSYYHDSEILLWETWPWSWDRVCTHEERLRETFLTLSCHKTRKWWPIKWTRAKIFLFSNMNLHCWYFVLLFKRVRYGATCLSS